MRCRNEIKWLKMAHDMFLRLAQYIESPMRGGGGAKARSRSTVYSVISDHMRRCGPRRSPSPVCVKRLRFSVA